MSKGGARSGRVTVFVALLLGACAGGGEDAPAAVPANVVVGRAPPEARAFPSVVLLRRLDPGGDPAPPPAADTVVMDQYGMQFVPEVVLARPGQPVAFTNSDDTPHIVTVRSEASGSTLLDEAIDVGTRFELTLDAPGTYEVSCSMHPGMAGIVLVHEAAYTAVSERDGSWRIPDVPPGTYELDAWSADPARRWRDTLEVGAGTTVAPDHTGAGR